MVLTIASQQMCSMRVCVCVCVLSMLSQVGTRHVSGTISPAGENSWLLICRVDGRQFRLTAVMHGDTLHLFSDVRIAKSI